MLYRIILVAVLLFVTDTRAADSKLLAFHLIAGGNMRQGFTNLASLKLEEPPIINDGDFRAYSTNEPSFGGPAFTITADAAKRLHNRLWELKGSYGYEAAKKARRYELCGPDTPFVLVASGQPIYMGVFIDPRTSRLHGLLPTIRPMPGFYSIDDDFTNNVTFAITFPGVTTNYTALTGKQPPPDMRNDKRILEVVKRLGL